MGLSPAAVIGVQHSVDAFAASQPLVPARCFAQVGVDHVVFGPDSFFLPNIVQGPTSFKENAGPTIVTYPSYRGTSQGRNVFYVITDASDRTQPFSMGIPPLNILKEIPEQTSQFDYSPLWDIHLETWTNAAVTAGLNVRQTDFSAAAEQVTSGLATGFRAGAQFGPSGFIVNCPVVSLDVNPGG